MMLPAITYLASASLFLLFLYGAYWLFFRKSTFHQLNRLSLLLIIIAALVLPTAPNPLPLASGPLYPAVESDIPAGEQRIGVSAGGQAGRIAAATTAPSAGRHWSYWLLLAWQLGFTVLLARLLLQLFLVFRLLYRADWARMPGGWLASSSATVMPFSFWKVVFLPDRFGHSPHRPHILAHEMAHQQQWHTVDLLLVELFCAFFWFHPAAWGLNRSLRFQLEHLADEAVLQLGMDKKAYQYSLLSLATHRSAFTLTNSFNQSLIKTRIVMMNVQKSPGRFKWKYLVLFPLSLLLVFALNDASAQSETGKKETGITVGSAKNTDGKHGVGISENSSSSGNARENASSIGIGRSAQESGAAVASSGEKTPYESVFVAIGAEFPAERLPELKRSLKEQGVILDIEELEYNADKLITRIKVNVKTTDGKLYGNGFSDNDGAPIEHPILFYVSRDGGKNRFGIYNTNKLDEKVPANIRSVLNRMENGFFVGKIIMEE